MLPERSITGTTLTGDAAGTSALSITSAKSCHATLSKGGRAFPDSAAAITRTS